MELKKFKEKNPKKVGIILFTISCILLISGVILYRTFAIFQVDTTQNVINGSIEDPGDIYFAFYKDGNIQKEMPQRYDGYILDENQSYCGISGKKDETIKPKLDPVDWSIKVIGITTSRTKCNLYFKKGAYILGKGIPIVTEGNGLYEVTHENITGTINDRGFGYTEYRYAGSNPDNYVTFNDETWRIIGLVNVMINENTMEQRVKIVRNDTIGSFSWDSSESTVNDGLGKSDWSNADLNKLLNNFYYNSLENQTCYNGKNNQTTPCSFNTNGMKEKTKYMIENIYWNIASVTQALSPINYYSAERTNIVLDADKYIFQANIGLISLSDYGYATSGKNSEQRNKCLNSIIRGWKLINDKFNSSVVIEGLEECVSNDWLYKNDNFWTITHSGTWVVFPIYDGVEFSPYGWARAAYNIYPSLYLKSSVKIISGTGSSTETYKLNEPYS